MHFLLSILHCLNPKLPDWVGCLNPYGSSELEKFWVNTFEFVWKKPEFWSTRCWVLSPLCTSSSNEFPTLVLGCDWSTWHNGGIEGTNKSLLLYPTVPVHWGWAWIPGTTSGTELSPARLAQSKFPDPRLWKPSFSSSWLKVFREFTRGKLKNLSSIAGNDSRTSSRCDEDEDDETLLCSLLIGLVIIGFWELELFL